MIIYAPLGLGMPATVNYILAGYRAEAIKKQTTIHGLLLLYLLPRLNLNNALKQQYFNAR